MFIGGSTVVGRLGILNFFEEEETAVDGEID